MEQIRQQAVQLNSAEDLDVLVEAIGDKKYVLLGEATHGTSEFYKLRMELSRKLIEKKGFSFIAVEGDWPSCYEVNRYVKQYKDAKPNAREVMEAFNRWPTWMWANEEVGELMEWLKQHNEDKPLEAASRVLRSGRL